ncbi:MAG: DNA polymerase III subunit gamma/tau [Acidobacteriota bacterium]
MAYEVLARKYRPQTFDEVVGQKLVTDTLKNAILQDRVAHGYLFSGARGVGKTTTARILAKALNCAQGPTVTPCGECDSCREIASSSAIDVLEIDAASNRGIDEIRELRESARYLPSRDRRKVFIIDEVHMLTPEAFNALLKTLEEPPESVLFILATTEAHKIPTTILSRCQHFAFRLVDYREILGELERIAQEEQIQSDAASLGLIARAAAGSLRDGLSLLDQAIAYSGQQLDEESLRRLLGAVPDQILEELMRGVHASDAARVLEGVERLIRQGFEIQQLTAELTRFIRNLMVVRVCGPDPQLLPLPEESLSRLKELAAAYGPEDLSRFLQIMLRTQAEVRYALEPRFHLELALMKLVHAQRLEPLENLLVELGKGATKTASKPAAPGSAAKPAPTAEVDKPPLPVRARPDVAVGASEPELRHSPARTPPPTLLRGADAQPLALIRDRVQARSKLLSNFLEHNLVGWRLQDGQARFTFSEEVRWALDILTEHENRELLRSICSEVLGQPVQISVSVEESGNAPADEGRVRLSPRERAERDPRVRAVIERFKGAWLGTRDLSQE